MRRSATVVTKLFSKEAWLWSWVSFKAWSSANKNLLIGTGLTLFNGILLSTWAYLLQKSDETVHRKMRNFGGANFSEALSASRADEMAKLISVVDRLRADTRTGRPAQLDLLLAMNFHYHRIVNSYDDEDLSNFIHKSNNRVASLLNRGLDVEDHDAYKENLHFFLRTKEDPVDAARISVELHDVMTLIESGLPLTVA